MDFGKIREMPGSMFRTKRTELGIGVASALFVSSFLMPAYDIGKDPIHGFDCFTICLRIIHDVSIHKLENLYYVGLGCVNFVFIAIVAASLARPRFRKLAGIVGLVAGLHVLPWLVLNSFSKDVTLFESIGVGYYVWLASFALLTVALLRDRTTSRSNS